MQFRHDPAVTRRNKISDELDAGWAREEAAAGFGGPVEVAAEGAVYEV